SILLDLVEFGFEHVQGHLAVSPLAPFGLAGDHDSGWEVCNANGRFNFIDVLAPFAAASKGVDRQIFFVDLDRNILFEFRYSVDTRERRVTPLIRIERRDSHKPMDASLGLNVTVGVFAGHKQRNRFDPGFVSLLNVDNLALEPIPLNPSLIHPE